MGRDEGIEGSSWAVKPKKSIPSVFGKIVGRFNPLEQLFFLVLAHRVFFIFYHFYGTDHNGREISTSPLSVIPFALIASTAVVVAISGGASLLWRLENTLIWKRFPVIAHAIVLGTGVLSMLLVFIGELDFELQRSLGQHLDPSLMRTNVHSNIFSEELFHSIKNDIPHVSFVMFVLFGTWALCIAVVVRYFSSTPALLMRTGSDFFHNNLLLGDQESKLHLHRPGTTKKGPSEFVRVILSDLSRFKFASFRARFSWRFVFLVMIIISWIFTINTYGKISYKTKISRMSQILKPPEVSFVREWLGMDAAHPPENEHEAIAELRSHLWLPPGRRWASDQYPLVHVSVEDFCRLYPDSTDGACVQPETAAPKKPVFQPDVFVIAVESLRGSDMPWQDLFKRPGEESCAPNMGKLASKSVVFPRMTSCGYPSREGFFCIHCSSWPHHSKVTGVDYTSHTFDSIPYHLRKGMNYYTTFLSASNPQFDNQLTWVRKWYHEFMHNVGQTLFLNIWSTKTAAEEQIKAIKRHDTERPTTPLFSYIATSDTHYPYRGSLSSGFSDAIDGALSSNIGLRYRQLLKRADSELEILFKYLLEERANATRRDNTIIVIVGDHSFTSDEASDPVTRGYPCNEWVWTSGFVYGPEHLIGKPRTIHRPASQADLLPTILGLVGDSSAVAALGVDLLAAPQDPVEGTSSDAPEYKGLASISVTPKGSRYDSNDGCTYFQDYSGDLSWVEPSMSRRDCIPVSVNESPITGQQCSLSKSTSDLTNRRVAYYSYLIESDRVWTEQFLTPHLWTPELIRVLTKPLKVSDRNNAGVQEVQYSFHQFSIFAFVVITLFLFIAMRRRQEPSN